MILYCRRYFHCMRSHMGLKLGLVLYVWYRFYYVPRRPHQRHIML